MKSGGIGLLIAGAVLAMISFVLPVSVDTYSSAYLESGSVINIGKLQTQMLVFQSGAALFLAGAIFTVGGAILERMAHPRTGSPAAVMASVPTAPAVGDAPELTPEQVAENESRAAREARGNTALAVGMILLLAVVVLIAVFTGPGA